MMTTLRLFFAKGSAISAISIIDKSEAEIALISDHLDHHLGRNKYMIGVGRITREEYD